MTEKRYLLKYGQYETSNGEIIEVDPEYIDKEGEYIDEEDYYTIDGYPVMSDKQVVDLLNKLSEENMQFKEALKELKEIGDYQAMRIQELCDMNSLIEDEIDKKIAVLTDAKIKSFQNEDKELLGKIKFSIQVLRELKGVIYNDRK